MGATRIARAIGLGIVACALAACGSAEEKTTASATAYPPALVWQAQPNASSYRVQAWSGLRLLFEETTPDTSLVLTPALLRAMAPFDSCRIEVRLPEPAAGAQATQIFWVKRGS